MAKKSTEEAIKELSLTETIADMIKATIDADQAVTADYLEAFQDYAFSKSPTESGHWKLDMVDFEMTDSEGKRQVVSIPKLSLLPLPVLHISEASFDFEAQVRVKEEDTSNTEGVALTPAQRRLLNNRFFVSFAKTGARNLVKTAESEKEINMKIHVKLQPTQLSNGMRGMIQEADSSIQVIGEDA